MLEAEAKLSPDLVRVLSDAGAEDYAPVLALKGIHTMKQLAYTTDRELSEVV